MTHGLDVLDAGVGKSTHPRRQHFFRNVRKSERGFGHPRNGDAVTGEPIDEHAGVVADLGEIYLEPRCGQLMLAVSFVLSCGIDARTISTR